MTTDAAEISAQRVIAELYQFYMKRWLVFALLLTYGEQEVLVSQSAQQQPEQGLGTYVPSNSKSESIVAVAGTELRNGSWEGKPSGHFTQALHHGKDRDTGEGVAKQDRKRAGLCESTSDT